MNLTIKQHFFFSAALSGLLALSPFSLAAKSEDPSSADSYTINYNTVSIIEYIKFAAKICNANFIFNAEDLPFTVSVVSDAPITRENVLATLIQMLRIHGLLLLEQGNNLVIHKSGSVRQIATLVFEDGKNPSGAGIITRVFRVRNASPDSIATIVRPMISEEALLEVSRETRQLIITDVTANIDKIAALIENLDTPHTTLEIRNFEVTYNSPEILIHLANQIMHPLVQETSFILVPQSSSNSIFIVSTPELADQAAAVLKTLDTKPKAHPLDQSKDSIGPEGKPSFFIYKLKTSSPNQVEDSLKSFAAGLEKSHVNASLVQAIQTMKYIKETNSLLFTAPEAALQPLQELLPQFDETALSSKEYFIYKVQHTTGDLLEDDLETIAKNMKASGLKDTPLVRVIDTMRYVKETNSLILTGDSEAINEAKELLIRHDYPHKGGAPLSSNFFLYKPQHVTAQQIEQSLKDVGTNLKKANLADPHLLAAIDSLKYIASTNSLIFTGTPDSIQKLQSLLKEIDVPPERHTPIQHVGKTTFLLYKLKNANGTQIMASLKAIATDLKKSGTSDKEFLTALNSMKYIKETNSLMFTGSEASLSKVQALAEKFDVTGHFPSAPSEGIASAFFIYRPHSVPPQELEKTLLEFAENLKMSGLHDPGLFHTLQSMKYIEKTQSILFTGDQKDLDRLKELLKEFDIPANLPLGATGDQTIQAIDNTNFLVYKLQFHKGDEIQGALRQIAKDLTQSNTPINQNLLSAINSIQWLEVTNSLLSSGDQETLTRLRELIKNLDIPLKQVFIEILVIQTSLSNTNDFGLVWGGSLQYKNKFSTSFNNAPTTATSGTQQNTFLTNLQKINASTTPTPSLIPFAPDFQLGVIGDIIMHKGQSFLSLGSLLNAIQVDNEASTILTPKIITQDSKTSTIFIGSNVPFAGSFISNSTANTVTTSNIEYRDIGFNLTITPVLGNSDIITLDISIDNSTESAQSTGATFDFNAGTAQGITTNRATMQTTVHVPDRSFLILSGMAQNINSKSTQGLPCLGGIPLIGAAFSQNNTTDANNNVVIFMRPTILNSIEEMKKITADSEAFFREQSGTPYLEHNFDEGMETIKSPDDE